MATDLFRKVALERLSSPEQLDQLIRVTSARGWLALSALVMLIAAAVAWGVLSSIPTRISAPGILMGHGGVRAINSTAAGQVKDILVDVGQPVRVGDVVATISRAGEGEPRDAAAANVGYVYSRLTGTVLELMVDRGSNVTAGTPLASIEASTTELEAVLFVPLAEGKKVEVGQAVQISPSTFKKEEYGYMLGTVREVAPFPSTPQGILRLVQNEKLAERLGGNEAPIKVVVGLERDPNTVSRYKWSSDKGAACEVSRNTPCSATITIREQAPMSLVIPAFKEFMGL